MGSHTWLLVPFGLGVACGLFGAALMLRRARRGRLPVDLPDERRLHAVATPRGGGTGIVLAGVAVVLLVQALAADEMGESLSLAWTVGVVWALPNGLLGWFDDHRPMRSPTKFAVQALAALVAATQGLVLTELSLPLAGTLSLGPFAWPLTVLWLVWMANVFNFMDGIDALAAGCGFLFFAGFAVMAALGSCIGVAALALALAGALLGFLKYNRPPARIFMGDGGSLYAGAALGGLAVALAQPICQRVPFVASVLLLGPFVWDATYTITWRALTGEPMRPHRTHLFQRLVLAGWGQGRVRSVFLGLGILGLAGAVAYLFAPGALQLVVLLIALLVGVGLVVLTRAVERSR